MRELPAIKQKLEELTADLRKRLKEIEEEMKPLSEEERIRARAARMEAVKTKQTALPFGIELEKPNTDNMEIRVAPEKDIIEEEYGIKLSGKPKVLIVDDSKVVRSTIKASLEGACDIVGLATNGSEAIQMYEVFRPDFVTLDLEMPGISGIETLKKIKQIDLNAKIIIMTSRSESKFVMEALKNGAVAYLLKPAPKEKLLEIISKK
jgi:two-component system chemotaxis response regulator CheY